MILEDEVPNKAAIQSLHFTLKPKASSTFKQETPTDGVKSLWNI